MNLHPHHAGLCVLLDPQWRRKLWIGGLVLCIPLVGWPALLGYRARFVRHLHDDRPTALPEWRGAFLASLWEGVRAAAVIFAHLLPLYAVLAWVALARGYAPSTVDWVVAAAMVAFPIFSPLSFPLACVRLATATPPVLGAGECALAIAAFSAVIFCVPAGFLAVSRTGRYRDAFRFAWTLPFLARNFRDYCRAWWSSICMSLPAHFALPLAPWGVAWCYLGIVALFNETLWRDEGCPKHGLLPRIVAAEVPRTLGVHRCVDAAGAPARVFHSGLFTAVLPGAPR